MEAFKISVFLGVFKSFISIKKIPLIAITNVLPQNIEPFHDSSEALKNCNNYDNE